MTELLIFDCDGTLVDSEYLYNSITAELLNGLGFAEYTPALCIELFGGQSWSTIKTILQDKHGQAIPRDIIDRYIALANARMDDVLHAPAGAHDLLARVKNTHQICVASNGERNNVIKSLHVTGLASFFDERHIFTKIQVARPKPAPDLFLFACDQMQVRPHSALVIEDSVAGVSAAHAAGIEVLGFVGTAHDREKQAKALKAAGAQTIIDEFIHIERHIST